MVIWKFHVPIVNVIKLPYFALTQSSVCNTPLPLKRTPIKDAVKGGVTLISAVALGYVIADAPEIFQTKKEIIKIHEAMNACMIDAKHYSKQRDLCACAETYENMKWFQEPKDLFEKNRSKCI